MVLQLILPEDLEARLRHESQLQGSSPDALAIKLLAEHLPVAPPNPAAAKAVEFAAMLNRWNEEDAAMTEEENDSNLEVLRSIDQDRMSYRQLFTDVLRDESK